MLAFAFMDIHTAAKYMQHGYRVRRSSWEQGGFIYDDRYFISHVSLVNDGLDGKRPFESDWMPESEDLVADDWELITEGIVSHFPVTYEVKP